jgi:hypothetical protein
VTDPSIGSDQLGRLPKRYSGAPDLDAEAVAKMVMQHASCDPDVDKNPQAMRQRRETAEHPFGTMKMRIGATHFLTKRLPEVATEMALHVLAYNLTRVMNIMGIRSLIAAMGVLP